MLDLSPTAPRHIASLVAIASSRTAKRVVVYPNSSASTSRQGAGTAMLRWERRSRNKRTSGTASVRG